MHQVRPLARTAWVESRYRFLGRLFQCRLAHPSTGHDLNSDWHHCWQIERIPGGCSKSGGTPTARADHGVSLFVFMASLYYLEAVSVTFPLRECTRSTKDHMRGVSL